MEEKTKSKKVDITPDISLFPKLGKSGYRVAEALGEFIDNSIDARPEEQKNVEVRIELSSEKVVIQDNAKGMNEKEAINSLRLAYSKKVKQLGQFGLGMKTAATSLGKHFTLKTATEDSDDWSFLSYDEDEWLRNKNWSSQEIQIIPKENKKGKGTTIIIKKLSFIFYPNLVTNVKRALSFRFAPYLENGLLKLKINTAYCEAPSIDLVSNKRNSIKIIFDEKNNITGWYGFLKKRKGMHYGFNLYKNGRLIEPESKFGFEPHAEIALLYGELNFDFVPTTHNKREFINNSYEYNESKKIFSKFLKDNKITSKARELSKLKTIKKTEIKLKEKLTSFANVLKTVKSMKELGIIEERKRDLSEIKEKSEIKKIKIISKEKRLDLNSLEEGKFYDLEIMGEKLRFKFNLIPLGIDKKAMQYFLEENKVTIVINTDFPLYEFVKDYLIYSLFLISEAIGEVVVKEFNLNEESILEIRDHILRQTGVVQKNIENQNKLENERRRLLSKLKIIDKKIK